MTVQSFRTRRTADASISAEPRLARLSILGLGYVGCVSAACFAERGHQVIGVDANPAKTEFLAQGKAPVVEELIGELTLAQVNSGRLTVSGDTTAAVAETDVTLVCVGTPSAPNGALSTSYLERATEQIGAALARKSAWHTVVYRSTMVPGTCENLLIPILERVSGKRVGVDFGVCVNPEFLREGSSVRDFRDPPKTVVGESDSRSGAIVTGLYDGLPGQRFRVPIAVAEMMKYVDNSFHALKAGFANEVGAICASLGIDSHEVMDIFLADTKLNISPAYLRPGFAFGGSCLPKDVRALTHVARRNDVEVPVLSNLLFSNEAHLRRAVETIVAQDRRKIGIFGLSFKPGTDDLRESPLVELAERLLGKGFDVKIYDSNVSLSRLIGANQAYIADRLPHLGELLTGDIDQVADHAEVLVIGSHDPAITTLLAGIDDDRMILDLIRVPEVHSRRDSLNYKGIAW